MIFVDTGAWFALSVATDPDHARAKRFIGENQEPLLTSDYIVDELLTLFIVRRQKLKGVDWLHDVLNSGGVTLVRIGTDDFDSACQLYERFADKSWSFTDCTSYVVMRRSLKRFRLMNISTNLELCRFFLNLNPHQSWPALQRSNVKRPKRTLS